MRVLFLGWEFPPQTVGGLGVHTYNIVKALNSLGVSVSLILPKGSYQKIDGVKFIILPTGVKFSVYSDRTKPIPFLYNDLLGSVEKFAQEALDAARNEDFDVIQANDWLTAIAGIRIKQATHKPLVITIHSTEYDRTIGNPWKWISDIEKLAMNEADIVVTVSNRMKQEIISLYGINPEKIKVIYNAINRGSLQTDKFKQESELILYVGRLSIQKGVDHLIRAFKIVAENDPEAILGIAGDGPEMKNLIALSINLGLAGKVLFFGRVSDTELEQLYRMARVFVMPSVSEPFGITALESVASGTPTIISTESGVSEVLKNVFKVNFWDSNQIADIILGILKYPAVGEEIAKRAYNDISNITWENSARKFIGIYNSRLSSQ